MTHQQPSSPSSLPTTRLIRVSSSTNTVDDNEEINTRPSRHIPQKSIATTSSSHLSSSFQKDALLYPLSQISTPASLKRVFFSLDGTETLLEELSEESVDITPTELVLSSPRKRPASSFTDADIENHKTIKTNTQQENPTKTPEHQSTPSEIPSEETNIFSSETHQPTEYLTESTDNTNANYTSLNPLEDTQESPNSVLPSPSLSPEMSSETDNQWAHSSERSEANRLIELFSCYPPSLQSYVLLQLSKRSTADTLRHATTLIMQSLRTDLIIRLPLAISHKILCLLDIRSLCRATLVSQQWRSLIEETSDLWKHILQQAEFDLSKEEQAQLDNVSACQSIYKRHHIMRLNWKHNRAQRIQLYGHSNNAVTCLQFDDEKLITGSDDQSVNVYDIKSGKLIRVLNGHSSGVWALKYIGNTLVTGSTDRSLKVWDITTGECKYTFQGHASTVRCLIIITPEELSVNGSTPVQQPSQPLIVSGSRDATLKVWRLPNLNEEEEKEERADEDEDTVEKSPYLLHTLNGHAQSVRTLAAHGNTVVSGSYDYSVRVWDVEEGKAKHVLNGHLQKVYSVVIDSKRNRCISGSMDSTVRIWSLEDGSCVHVLRGKLRFIS
ncbi:WD40-repeat-containing domain protein [Spinellus fusiger]|nr:WD40-repeat-containing domain protein [Spinellus fusiger]